MQLIRTAFTPKLGISIGLLLAYLTQFRFIEKNVNPTESMELIKQRLIIFLTMIKMVSLTLDEHYSDHRKSFRIEAFRNLYCGAFLNCVKAFAFTSRH